MEKIQDYPHNSGKKNDASASGKLYAKTQQ